MINRAELAKQIRQRVEELPHISPSLVAADTAITAHLPVRMRNNELEMENLELRVLLTSLQNSLEILQNPKEVR